MRLSQRIWSCRFDTEEDFEELMAFLKEYPGCLDEISLFTDYLHSGIYPLRLYEEKCRWIGECIKKVKKQGIASVGVNVLSTIGHLAEADDFWPDAEFPLMVGEDGRKADGVYCPNYDEYREYIKEKYRITARMKPDFIWVDDDIRMHSHGIDFGCFCPKCIDLFNKNNQTAYTREELVRVLNSSEGEKERYQWVKQNMDTLAGLLSDIRVAVYEVDTNITLGLMTTSLGWTTYSGWSYRPLFEKLNAEKGRPGGGFWTEETPAHVFYKSLEAGRQIDYYPEFVNDIQYEVENLPYNLLEKCPGMIITECTASFLCGVNGIAFDVIRHDKGGLEDYRSLLAAIEKARPLWKQLEKAGGKLYGCAAILSSKYMASRKVTQKDWFTLAKEVKAAYYTNQSYALSALGIPLCTKPCEGVPVILEKDLMCGYTKDEIEGWLRNGAFMDGEALEYLWSIGLGKYSGVHVKEKMDNGVREKFTKDALNGGYAGEERDMRMKAINKGHCYILESENENVRIISELYGFNGTCLGAGFTVFENEFGGRVAVCGYFPWHHVFSGAKRHQMLNVFEWLCGGRLPVRVLDYKKVVPLVRYWDNPYRLVVMLTNISMESTGIYKVRINTDLTCGKLWRSDGTWQKITGEPGENGTIFEMDDTLTMDFRILEFTEEEQYD